MSNPTHPIAILQLIRPTENVSVSQALVANRKLIEVVAKQVSKRLLVSIASSQGFPNWTRSQLPTLYNDLWDVCLDNDKIGLDCVVLCNEGNGGTAKVEEAVRDANASVVFNVGPKSDANALTQAKVDAIRKGVAVVDLSDVVEEELNGEPFVLYDNVQDVLPKVDNVVLGGTFDRFHNGHKKLLTISAAVCAKKITCGVTSQEMLSSKSGAKLIEPFKTRAKHVHDFVKSVNSSLLVHTEMITDPFGPSIVDPDLEAIVVSSETLKGARMVNDRREAKGMNRLTVVVALRSNVHTLSSSFVRHNLKPSAM